MPTSRDAFEPVLGIARPGWWLLLPLAAATLWALRHGMGLPALAGGLLMLLVGAVFRDPDRRCPARPLGVLAPVDGRVRRIELVDDPVLERKALAIEIAVSPLAAWSLRAPIEGEVRSVPRRWDGRPTVRLRTDEGDELLIVSSGGPCGGTVPVAYPFGTRVGHGQRCGYRRLATRITVVVPATAKVEVRSGQPVRSGLDEIATLAVPEPGDG